MRRGLHRAVGDSLQLLLLRPVMGTLGVGLSSLMLVAIARGNPKISVAMSDGTCQLC
jgi:hypothetical protein